MPETLFTVWVNLFERGFAADGDWVLVHGGTSGIGTMAIALGGLFGLHIIVTCGSEEKCARALELGADAAINYREQDFVEEVHRVTDRRGVDVVIDMVGGDYVPRNLACLAEEGRHVSIAVQRGADRRNPDLRLDAAAADPDRLNASHRVRSSSRRWSPMRSRSTVWPYAEGGRLKPVIDSIFPAGAGGFGARADGGRGPCRQDRAGDRLICHSVLARSAREDYIAGQAGRSERGGPIHF